MDHLLTTMMRTPPPGQPPVSYLTPPGSSDDATNQQPLDFSLANKRPRPSVTPILSVPAPPQPRRLLSDPALNSLNIPTSLNTFNSLNSPSSLNTFNSLDTPPSLPRAPLPLNFLQQSIASPMPGFPPASPLVSPFLLNPSLLLQMMTGAASSLPPPPASPPQTPASGSAASDKTELLRVNSESLGQYALFRQNMLRQLADKKTLSRRDSSDSNEAGVGGQAEGQAQDIKDQAYWERRRKNNLAAKRSRDARRAKEDEIAIRAAFLEQENIQLKWEVARLKSETARLRAMLMADSDTEDMDLNDLTSSA